MKKALRLLGAVGRRADVASWRTYAATFLFMSGSWGSGLAVTLHVPELGGNASDAGVIVAARFLVAGLLSFGFGSVIPAIGTGRVLNSAVAIAVGANAFPILANTLGSTVPMIGWAIATGVSVAAFWPAISAELVESTPVAKRGTAFGHLAFVMYAAVAVGPVIAGRTWDSMGPEVTYGMSAVLCLLTFPMVSRSRADLKLEPRPPIFRSLGLIGRRKAVWGAWIGTFSIGIPQGATIGLFPLLGQAAGMSASTVGLLLGAQAIAQSVSRLALGHVIDRWQLPATTIAIASASYAGLTIPLGFNPSVFVACLALTAGMIPLAMGLVLAQVVVVENIPPTASAIALGGYGTAVFLGAAVGPAVGGSIAAVVGYESAFLWIGAIGINFALTTFLLLRDVPRSGSLTVDRRSVR